MLRTSIDLTDHANSQAAAALGCPPPVVRYKLDELLSQELFGRESHGDFPDSAPGVLPFVPSMPLFDQAQFQEQYRYGSQDWCDDRWVRDKFEYFRFVCRLDDELVLINMRWECLSPDDPVEGRVMRLPAERSHNEVLQPRPV